MTLSECEATQFDESLAAASIAGVRLPEPRANPRQYQAAHEIFSLTQAMDIVLEGLTSKKHIRRELLRTVRRTLIYLVVVLFVASTLLVFFNEVIVTEILRMRVDMTLVPKVENQQADTTRWISGLSAVLSAACLVLLTILVVGRSHWVARMFGGKQYEANLETAISLKIIDRLVAANQPILQSTSLASDLVDASPPVRARLDLLARGNTGSANDATWPGIRSFADDFQSIALDQLAAAQTLIPMLLVPIVGGSAVLAYSVAVFWPVITLMKDLAFPEGGA